MLTPALVEALAEVLDANPDADGVIAAAPVTDTVKRAGWSRTTFHGSSAEKVVVAVGETLDRSALWSAQTPQLFRAAALREALAVDEAARDAATDEAMLIEAAGGTVLLHDPGAPNFKVTTPADLKLAELLLTERPKADGPIYLRIARVLGPSARSSRGGGARPGRRRRSAGRRRRRCRG